MTDVLVIDDQASVRATLRNILEFEGYEVMEADNGASGLSLMREFPVLLVVTDILMPEKEGIETILEIRQEFPETRILAISGGGQTQNLEFLRAAKKLGADEILKKPFTSEQLIGVVRRLITENKPRPAFS